MADAGAAFGFQGGGGPNPLPPAAIRQPAPGAQQAQALADQNRAQVFQNNLSSYMAGAGPQYDQLDAQRNTLLRNGQYGMANAGLDNQALNLQYQGNLGDANTAIGQNQIALSAAQRQPGVLDSLDEVQQRMFGTQREGYGLAAGRDFRQTQSSATAAGARQTGGTRQAYGDIYANLVNQLTGVDEQNQQFNINSAESKAAAKDRIDTLQLEANNLGMKPEQLQSMLQVQLQRAGLDSAKAYGDLMDGLRNNDADSMKLYYSLLQQAQAYTNAGG